VATPDQIAALRRLINEPDATTYTDAVLSTRLDAIAGDANALASVIWREKAATYAGLIDVQEGNSVRKMSQLYAQAVKMADVFDGGAAVIGTKRPARTRPIERQ